MDVDVDVDDIRSVDLLSTLIYKDEHWSYVHELSRISLAAFFGSYPAIEDNECVNGKVSIDAGSRSLHFYSQQVGEDWIYCYTDGLTLDNYSVKCKLRLFSVFTELQFAFRHVNILNRYRFRTIDNKFLVFEVIHRGQFYHNLCRVPFSFELDKAYDLEVRVKGKIYQFVVNGEPKMSVAAKLNVIPSGGFAFIMWNKSGVSDIRVNLDSIECVSN